MLRESYELREAGMGGWKLGRSWVGLVVLAVVACGGEGTGVVIDTEEITEPGHYIRNFGVDGIPRSFEVYVPASVDLSRPSPMVLAFHGNPQSSAQMRRMSDLDAAADTLGVVIVYPNKANGADWFWGCRECSIAGLNQIDDPKYVQAVIDKMGLDMNIDVDRVYATGFSQGGLMTYRLACLHDTPFAAFATVGSLMWTWHVDRCGPAAKKPFMMVQGVDDQEFKWEGARGNIDSSLSAVAVRDFFSGRNGCDVIPSDQPLPDLEDDGTSTVREVFSGCDAEVRFYRVEGGGHTWPGSPVIFGPALGKTAEDFRANDEILGFFLKHSR
jgi:polyhydroxybutyrate depolymerase